MSTEAPLSLRVFVAALIETLGEEHPAALARMKQIVEHRTAGISLDGEAVSVSFGPDGLRVESTDDITQLDGAGATDSATVIDLLDGAIEVPDAILDGRLRVTGALEEIARMFQAIEILLDASPRTPRLQALAARFQSERRAPDRMMLPVGGQSSWYPFASSAGEFELLGRLDLLPEPPSE